MFFSLLQEVVVLYVVGYLYTICLCYVMLRVFEVSRAAFALMSHPKCYVRCLVGSFVSLMLMYAHGRLINMVVIVRQTQLYSWGGYVVLSFYFSFVLFCPQSLAE